jgi:cephalosporin hydroxylase
MTKDRDAQQATKVKLIEDNLAQTAIVEKLRAACNQLVTAMVQLDKEHHREVAFAREALTADAKGGEKK